MGDADASIRVRGCVADREVFGGVLVAPPGFGGVLVALPGLVTARYSSDVCSMTRFWGPVGLHRTSWFWLWSVAVLGKQVLPAAGVREAVAVLRVACRTALELPMGQLSQSPGGGVAPTLPSASEPTLQDPRWAQEQLDRRNRQLGHASVARAQDILAGRYRLDGADAAFELLKNASQQSNIKLHTLADAVVRVPAPDQQATSWFPGRARFSPPRLPGLRLEVSTRGNQGAVLKAALHRVLTITQTPMGNVQLAEGGRLRLARHTGLNKYFTDFFAFVEAPTTSCAQAASARQQVTVREVATAAVFDEASRHAILQTGSRAAHSIPLANGKGRVLGMISSHHERPLAGFSRAQLAALQQTGIDAGRWLSWHWHTVVLDALEHLHAQAVGASR